MDTHVGRQVGNYRLVRLLGQGGFAEVYLGEHVYLKTLAAIKLLEARMAQNEMDRFLAEAQTIARLRHPAIVRLLEFGVEGGTPYLVMEYAPNGSLRHWHPRGSRLTPAVVLPYARQVAEALQYAHDERLIHRDVKPENMLVGPRGEVLLSDFGIATIAHSSRSRGMQDVAGTVAYMAPEQIQGQARPASDQYSLGVVVYEWLCGSHPFEGTFTEIVSQHIMKPPPSLALKAPDISPALQEVVQIALAKDPRERFASVLDFAQALELASQQKSGPLPRAVLGSLLNQPPTTRVSGTLAAPPPVDPQAETVVPSAPPPADQETGATALPLPDIFRTMPQSSLPRSERKPGLWRAKALLLALGVVLVVGGLGGLGYSVCCGKPRPTAAAPYPYTVPTHKGGTLVLAAFGTLETNNPWFLHYTNEVSLADALWGGPLVISPDGKYLPDELTEIPTRANGDVNKNGLTITLRLRHDLRWSDGQPLTADDFVYWLEVLLDPASGAASTAGYDQIVAAQAVDPYTLVLYYKQPFAPYLSYLPLAAPRHVWGGIPHNKLAANQEVFLAPRVNSGPFVVSDLDTSDPANGPTFTLLPNQYYVSTTLHATVLDRLVFKVYYDLNQEIADYQQGQVDLVDGLLPDNLARVRGLRGLQIAPQIGYTHLDFNMAKPALQPVMVRKAIEEAIDRCQLMKTVLQSASCETLRVDTILPKPSQDFDPTNTTYAYNLHAAAQDMQLAGWDCSSGVCLQHGQPFPTLTLATLNGALNQMVAGLIRQDLAALGIPVNIVTYGPELLSDYHQGGILATGQFDLTLIDYLFGIDADGSLYPNFHSSQIPSAINPSGHNYERVNDLGVDELLDEGRVTLDPATRSEHYKDVQRILVQKVYVVPLYLVPNITLTSPKIGNFLANPVDIGNEWNIGDWFLR
jgi:ABC-type transport system substrate-binding protein/serine/threonine protein kinase